MARSSLIPGFRFHPTDVELVMYYLKKKLLGKKITLNVVAEVNIYDYGPWDLPDKSSLKSGDLEWYFFCPKSKKYSSGGRANRATETGFWKATGKDRMVKYKERTVATIKTLVFHLGQAGKGERKAERTDWVMHEYRMDDEQLASAGIAQDMYVLCKIFEKSGSGPKNGAQYGAPFNEEEWDDNLVSSLDSQAIFGPLGASSSMDHKQKGPATTNMTDPGSSIVTFSANEPTNTLNYKQKGPATTIMTEPGSIVVTSSANESTNTLDYKQKGPATTSMTEPGSTIVIDEPINTLDYKQKGTTTMNMTVPQTKRGLSVTEPGSSRFFLPTSEMPVDDVLFLEDLLSMGVPEGAANGEKVETMVPNEDEHIFGDLVNLFNLEDLNRNDIKTDEAEYVLGKLSIPDDLGLGKFYVD